MASLPRDNERKGGRKRLRFEEEWTRKKRKIQKDSGEAYTSYKGDHRAEKELVTIECKCVHKCRSKVDDAERERLFSEFYKLKSHESQNKYLYGLMSKQPVKRKRGNRSSKSRSHTIAYRVRLRDGSHVQVCKKTFCDLHAVSKRRVEILLKKLRAGLLLATDERGKHSNRPHAIQNVVKECIREHIKSFPKRASHYSRNDNRKRAYLSENLSISRMYRLYLDKYEPEVKDSGAKPQVKEWLY